MNMFSRFYYLKKKHMWHSLPPYLFAYILKTGLVFIYWTGDLKVGQRAPSTGLTEIIHRTKSKWRECFCHTTPQAGRRTHTSSPWLNLDVWPVHAGGWLSLEEQRNHPVGRRVRSSEFRLERDREREMVVSVKNDTRLTSSQSSLCAGFAGFFSKTVTSPLEVVKIKSQVGTFHCKDGFLKTFIVIYQNEGLRGFWKGNMASCLRLFPYTAVHLTAYKK